MSVLEQFGVSAGELADHSQAPKYPKPVQGRVVHIDADFMAYQVSAESKEELDPTNDVPRKSLEDMQHNARAAAEHLMRLAGATSYVCHVTPSGSTKGGRDAQAIQQEYQANRKDRKNKPEHLDAIRAFIARELNGKAHLDQEADDGMAQAAYNAEDPNLVVIASKDKDLLMVPGLHLMVDTGRIVNCSDRFGHIEVDDSKSSKKVIGLGTKFFWAQVLMGDTADNIRGLPAVPGAIYLDYQPTAAYTKAMKQWSDLPPKSDLGTKELAAAERLEKSIDAMRAKTKPCGPVMTALLLEDCKSDKDCFVKIKMIFEALGRTGHEFRHWKTGAKVTPTQAMLSDMQLLWMRRNKNPNDVVDWLKGVLNG